MSNDSGSGVPAAAGIALWSAIRPKNRKLAGSSGWTNSIRLNADFKFNNWLKLSASNSFIKINDFSPIADVDMYRIISRLAPDSNVLLDNPDGQPYYFKPDPWESEIDNPLYDLYAREAQSKQQRFLGGYKFNFKISIPFLMRYT